MHAGNANEKKSTKGGFKKKKESRKKGRERKIQKKERRAGVKFNISVAFLQPGSLGVHADYREDDLETLQLLWPYTTGHMSSIRRVSRKLIKTTKVHVNPRNTCLDMESFKRTKWSFLREKKYCKAVRSLLEYSKGKCIHLAPPY